jgi:outer membrane lipoprotein carrier protein
MKHSLFLLASILFVNLLVAQSNNQYTSTGDSDPEAKSILDKLRKKYDSYKAMEANFTLTIELPEEPVEEQKGKMLQKGEKYVVMLGAQEIYCNGETLWLYLKNNNEVQINSVEEDEEGEMLTPNELLRIYESEEYSYVLANAFTENGRVVQQVEFKPLDRDSEYSKMRLTVDKKANEVVRIKVFSKDGSRYTLKVDDIIPNKKYPDSRFVFDTSLYPDLHVEDLRID